MHQSCTKTCTIPCTKPLSNHASTKTYVISCANTISCINYVSHHASISPRNSSYIYQKCISNNVPTIQAAPQTMCLNHIPYHSWYVAIIPYTMYHKISSMNCLNKVPNNQDHIPSICLNHAPNLCFKHVPMPQQYNKNLSQACTINSTTCNPQNIHINIHVTL